MIKDIKAKPQQPILNKAGCKMALLRLKKDLSAYEEEASDINFVKLAFPDPQSIQNIQIAISPQQNSPYNHTQISFALTFPDSYPIDPPKLKCLNRVFHPNINYNGSVCLPLVREDWSPTTSLFSIVCGLIFILTYPNSQDPLEPQIGEIMTNDQKIYQKIVIHTIQGRIYHGKQYDNIIKTNEEQLEQNDELNNQC